MSNYICLAFLAGDVAGYGGISVTLSSPNVSARFRLSPLNSLSALLVYGAPLIYGSMD
jgi:hypothetical protein